MQEIREEENKQEQLKQLLEQEELQALVDILEEMPVVEVADFLSRQSDENILNIISLFKKEERGLIFTDFNQELQLRLFRQLNKKDFAKIFSQMYSDVRADLYQEMTKEEQTELLPYLGKKTREDVIALSAYPPETAGGIMNTDFATIVNIMTVQEAIEKIRHDAPSKKMVYYIYVVDEQIQMLGFVTLKDLVLATPDALVEDLIHENYIYAHVADDRESVAKKIEKYDLVAIPVLNDLHQLVGIVSHDDALDVIRKEHTEDMEKFMGIVPDDEGLKYLETSPLQHFRKRVAWILSLAAFGIISGVIVHRFESALEQLIILALYMPMMADTGGNAGSQAATVVIRALALGQVNVRNWLRIIFKEARIAILLAVCLGILTFGKILYLSYETQIPEELSLIKIAVIISLALCLQVISSTIIGAGLPLIVKRFGGDPAVAASPAITTIVDITGLLIYFGMATAFLL
jgi:magnesium transporter